MPAGIPGRRTGLLGSPADRVLVATRESTADANPITADLEDVIVRQQSVADQRVVDADPVGPEQIDDPQAQRGS